MIGKLFVLILLVVQAFSEDETIEFVKKFVENEGKPTAMVLAGLCWRLDKKIKLVNSLMETGISVSTAMDIFPKFEDHFMLFFVDVDCEGAQIVIENAMSRDLQKFPYRWLAIVDSNSSNDLRLWDYPLLADSDFVLAKKRDYGFEMVELHKPSPPGPTISTLRGFYHLSNSTLTDVRPARELFWRRKDVMGHPLTMSNVIQDSNSTQYHLPREDRLELQFDAITKIAWMGVKLAFQMLNATPQYVFSHRWGYKQNGSWSGMINDLYENRADVGTNCLATTPRLAVATYTDTLAPYTVRFVFRQPPLSYVSNIFSLPFSMRVWVAIAVCTLVAAGTLCVASKWEAALGKSPTILDGSVGDALLLTMSAVAQQGCVLEPKKWSGRLVVWVLFTALMALYAAYSANIVVLLQAPSTSLRTLADLARSRVTLAANDVDYNHFVFALYDDPVRVQIRKRIQPEKGNAQFYEINEGVERIRQGLFAFHSIAEPVYLIIEKTFLESEKCDLMDIDFLNEFDPITPVKKDSPYLELLRVCFKRVREAGLRSALTKRLQTSKPACPHHVSAFTSAGIQDLLPVLLLMVYGFMLSVVVAAAEIFLFKLNQRRIRFRGMKAGKVKDFAL